MPFSLHHTGNTRPRSDKFEISVADFRQGAAGGGAKFWRGLVIGVLCGLALSYSGLHRLVESFLH